MVHVKVCGITTLDDALGALEAGADALGFNFYRRSPRYVEPARAREIIERLPESILSVGVFVNEPAPEDVARMAEESGVSAAQLHGDESAEFCDSLPSLRVIKALRVGEDFDPADATRYAAEAILLDAFSAKARGGTGETFDWSVARRTRELVPRLYLAGGLTPENVADAVEAVRPFAVDVCSGVENAPGRKDAARLRAFVAAARGADGKS
jgi:phosphoribosylanthranilate isomerase